MNTIHGFEDGSSLSTCTVLHTCNSERPICIGYVGPTSSNIVEGNIRDQNLNTLLDDVGRHWIRLDWFKLLFQQRRNRPPSLMDLQSQSMLYALK